MSFNKKFASIFIYKLIKLFFPYISINSNIFKPFNKSIYKINKVVENMSKTNKPIDSNIESSINKKKFKKIKSQILISKKKLKTFHINKYQIILILILFFALLVRCYDIDRPFIGHHSSGASHIALEAKNYLEYGYFNTKFGAVDSISYTPELTYTYYLNHPPLRALLVSISFLIFGVHEWSARFTGVVFFLFSILLIYLICKRIRNKETGIIAAFFASFMPMTIYFPKAAFSVGFTQFAILLVFYAYISWIKTNDNKYFILGILSILFGGFTDWPFYFLMPSLLIHYTIYRKRTNLNWMKLSAFFSLFIVIGLLVVSYLVYLKGSINYFDEISLR